jgi:uncharacterized protein (DUF488 family)
MIFDFLQDQSPALATSTFRSWRQLKTLLDDYKKSKGAWSIYADRFLDLMARRKIESIERARLDGGCLLCSEDKPHHCHRRLVAEYLKKKWGDVEIEHL